ncbi:efflux RND transporter periplasmic adaptor subunit [Pseudoalteromonas umbrosa]|uniref:efflux RND transporter periplasmic adaptor subunit n=1 Tax=Pseudoalteromonas umbrosa TaxID=3048489 RepID=UPI0024C23336|nr:efflux RND transporter periplasmic adaptor subunit [Pseudoalteromonas sp. B95]MDK1290635.1 efflux RND transporter periplasmic adaptor subunit [Pseudoalteromonas sp. B95]
MLKLLFIITLMCTSIAHAQQSVKTSAVVSQKMARSFTSIAEVVTLQEVDIAMEVEGKLEWVAQVGAVVKQGELVARLDGRLYELQYASHLEYMEELALQRTFAQREVERKTRLHREKGLSEQELDDVKQKLALLTQQVKKAEVDKQLYQLNVQRSQVLAPFDGQVVTRKKVKGAFVEAGDALLTLVDIYNKEISAKVPVAKSAGLFTGNTQVIIDTPTGNITGQLKSVVQAGDEHSRLAEVRITAEQPLPPIAMPLNVTFTTQYDETVWQVPKDALISKNNQYFVYQVDENKLANKVVVQVQSDTGSHSLLVTGPLHADREVIVRGAEQVVMDKPVVKL